MSEKLAAVHEDASLAELEAAHAVIVSKIAAAKLAAKADAIARVRALMAELGVTTRMLSTRSQAASKPAKPRHPSAGKKVAIKYRDPGTGETWSGRGLKPIWLRDAIMGGAKLEYFAVTAESA